MNIGIIGGGRAALAHIFSLQEMPDIDKIYVYTREIEQVNTLAVRFSKVRVAPSLKNLTEKTKGIIIATPNNTHFSLLQDIDSFKALPVLCEKPLASSLKEARSFLQLANPLSAVGFNYRFNSATLLILKILQKYSSKKNLTRIHLILNKNSALTKKKLTWKDSSEQNHTSGALGDLGSHLLDLVQYLSDSVIEASSISISKEQRATSPAGLKVTTEDSCKVEGNTKDQVTFKIQASKASPPHQLGFILELTFKEGLIQYFSRMEEPAIYLMLNQKKPRKFSINSPPQFTDPETEIPYWSDSFYLQDAAWVQQLITEQANPALATIEDGVLIQELLHAE